MSIKDLFKHATLDRIDLTISFAYTGIYSIPILLKGDIIVNKVGGVESWVTLDELTHVNEFGQINVQNDLSVKDE